MKPLDMTLILAANGKTGRRVAARLETLGHPARRASLCHIESSRDESPRSDSAHLFRRPAGYRPRQ